MCVDHCWWKPHRLSSQDHYDRYKVSRMDDLCRGIGGKGFGVGGTNGPYMVHLENALTGKECYGLTARTIRPKYQAAVKDNSEDDVLRRLESNQTGDEGSRVVL